MIRERKMTADVVALQGDGYGGRGCCVLPSEGDASLIFMHGRGGDGDEWTELAYLINERETLRGRIRLFLPTADEILVTKYATRMNAWFDSRSDRRDVDEDFEGFERSRKRIENIIEQEVSRGIKPERIIVAGFSQGGAMAYFVSLRSHIKLGGAVCMSGWCPFLKDLQVGEAFASSGAPFLHAHGQQDPVVDYQFARASFESACSAAKKVSSGATATPSRFQFRTYENLVHTASATEMDDVLDFIEKCLARNTQA